MKINYLHKKKVDWSYIKTLKYGKIKEYSPNNSKNQIGNLAGYVREKRCINCNTKTIKFNRCKDCYYKFRGWNKSHLSDKRKEGNKCISTATDEQLERLRDSDGSFRSNGVRKNIFPNSVTERLKHSERDWIGRLSISED